MKATNVCIRLLALVLMLCMTAAVFTGCSSNQTTENSTNDAPLNGEGTIETAVPTDENGFVLDSLPEDLNFGREMRILYSDYLKSRDVSSKEEAQTSVINNAVYSRWQTVQDRLGIEINWIDKPGAWNSSKNSFITEIETASTTGTAYDAVLSYNLFPGALAHKGLVENLYGTEYIDLSAPWWPASFVKESVYNDTVYGVVENSSQAVLVNMHGVFFNNQLIDNYHLESPYDMVANNTWTFENMMTMIKGVGADQNENAKKDSEDFYGLVTGTRAKTDVWFFAMGYRYSQKDENGDLELTISNSAKMVEWIDRFNTAFDSKDAWWFDRNVNGGAAHTLSFFENRAILYMSSIDLVDQAVKKHITMDYGVVPVPKGSESQENYINTVANHHDIWSVPINTHSLSESSALIECMASESYRQIAPVYFDQCVKLRYAPDERLYDMYDMIRDSITFDFFQTYSFVLESYSLDPRTMLINCVTDQTARANWGSQWAKNAVNTNNAFYDILALYGK